MGGSTGQYIHIKNSHFTIVCLNEFCYLESEPTLVRKKKRREVFGIEQFTG